MEVIIQNTIKTKSLAEKLSKQFISIKPEIVFNIFTKHILTNHIVCTG